MILVDENFFSLYDNHSNIRLETLDPERAELISRLIELAKTRDDLPMILPRRGKGETHWYFLPRTPQQSRLLRDQIRAFLAPPFSNYNGSRGNLITGDPFDDHVTSIFGNTFVKVTVSGESETREASNTAVKLFAKLIEEMPSATFELARPHRRVMSDFEWSLQLKDVEASRQFLDELALFGRLSQENMLFLSVRRLAALDLWDELLDLNGLEDMLRLRLPIGVVHAVVRAVNHEILTLEDKVERQRRLGAVKLESLGSLRIGQDGAAPPDVADAFKLLRSELGFDDQDEVTSTETPTVDVAVTTEIRTISEKEDPADEPVVKDVDEVETLFNLGKFSEALNMCLLQEPSARRAAWLLRIGYEDRTPDLLNRVLSDLNSWSDAIRDEVTTTRLLSDILQWIEDQGLNNSVPTSLVDWLEFFDTDLSDQKLQDLLDQYRDTWILKPTDRDSIEKLTLLIEQITLGPRNQLLRRNLAFIHEAAVGLEGPEVALLLEASMNALAIEEVLTATELAVLHLLADSILEVATAELRSRVLSELLNIWVRIATPNRLDWCLDVAVTVRATAGPGDDQSRSTLEGMASLIAAFLPSSVDPVMIPLVRLFMNDVLDLDACQHIFALPPGESVAVNPFEGLTGKKIGIYTTEHRRAFRIRDALQNLVTCDIRLNHDLKCTGQLSAMSRECDIVVVLTSAATHSATGCITDHRGHGETWLVHATGTSTVLAAIVDKLS